MRIRLKLLAVLREKTPPGSALQLPEGATVQDALRKLDIPVDHVQAVAINGRLEHDRGQRLFAEDELTVLPPVSGG